MADVTGAYMTPSCIVSQNTEAVLRHKARFVSGDHIIPLLLKTGTRYIIYSAITAGPNLSIGLSTDGVNIISAAKTFFTFAQAAGPLDLSAFFSATPFTQYFEPSATDVYLLVTTLGGAGEITIGVVEYKA